jgi:hypothetical protein
MSAQPQEQFPINPADYQQDMLPFGKQQERHLNLVPGLAEGEQQPTNIADQVGQFNSAIAEGKVPTTEDLNNMILTARNIATNEDGHYVTSDADALDEAVAKTFLHNAEPSSWLLSDEDKGAWEAIKDAPDAPNKQEAADRLSLSAQLTELMAEVKPATESKKSARERLDDLKKASEALDTSEEPKVERSNEQVADLVGLDGKDRGHRPDGKFMSKYEIEQVAANEKLIRKGLPALMEDIVKVSDDGRGRRPDGKFLSNDEVAQISENQDQIREGAAEINPAPEAAAETEEPLVRPEGVDEDAWNMLSEDEQKAAVTLMAEQAKADAKEADDDTITEEEIAAAEANPATATAKGTRGRIKRMQERANNRLMTMYNRITGKTSDPETVNKRRKLAAVVLGASAVAGAFLAYKGLSSGGGSGSGSATHHVVAGAGPGVGEVAAVAAGHVTAAVMKHGNTVWGIAREHLGGHPTNGQIFHETQRLLDLNHLSWEQARHMADGTEVKLAA